MTDRFFDDDTKKPRDDDEKERPSWRELDAKRDRSRHLSDAPKVERQTKPKNRRNEALAKAALESLFQPAKKTKEQEAAWKKVFEGPTKTFSVRVSNYVEKFGLPNDWDDLIRLLDHNDIGFVSALLDRLVEMAPNETPVRRDLLIGKLRVLKMEREEPELLSKFDSITNRLKEIPS